MPIREGGDDPGDVRRNGRSPTPGESAKQEVGRSSTCAFLGMRQRAAFCALPRFLRFCPLPHGRGSVFADRFSRICSCRPQCPSRAGITARPPPNRYAMSFAGAASPTGGTRRLWVVVLFSPAGVVWIEWWWAKGDLDIMSSVNRRRPYEHPPHPGRTALQTQR